MAGDLLYRSAPVALEAAVARRGAGAWRTTVLTLLVVHLPLVLVMIALLGLSSLKSIPYSDFTRDPVTALDGAYYIGWLSNLGVVIWLVGASVCLFTAAVLPPSPWRPFLLHAGLLTAVLGIDDLFLLHDGVLPQALGLDEGWVMGAYGLGLATTLFLHRHHLRQTCLPLLGLAMAFLALSVAVDLAYIPVHEHHRHLAEDGPKLLGIASWSAYFILMAFRGLRQLRRPLRETPAHGA